MNKEPELQQYFAEAMSWDADRLALQARSLRVAWIVAGGGWGFVLLLTVALLLLIPLKRVDPFVVRVDNTTGMFDVVPMYVGTADLPEALTRKLLNHYVTVCERFNFATAESDYQECGSMHTPQRNQLWSALWAKGNPLSPLNLFKDGTIVSAQVTAVSFFKRQNGVADLAQVRYVKRKRRSGSAEEQKSYWIATIQYAYGKPSKDPRLRLWNPFGFKILEFQTESEVMVEPTPAVGTNRRAG